MIFRLAKETLITLSIILRYEGQMMRASTAFERGHRWSTGLPCFKLHPHAPQVHCKMGPCTAAFDKCYTTLIMTDATAYYEMLRQ